MNTLQKTSATLLGLFFVSFMAVASVASDAAPRHKATLEEQSSSTQIVPRRQAPATEQARPSRQLQAVQPSSGQNLTSGQGGEKIACCTTFNTQEGTTGCATFEGNVCPSYAPYPAY